MLDTHAMEYNLLNQDGAQTIIITILGTHTVHTYIHTTQQSHPFLPLLKILPPYFPRWPRIRPLHIYRLGVLFSINPLIPSPNFANFEKI